jgi:response regulator RpfG family c-di-GMP phosphodiesterase
MQFAELSGKAQEAGLYCDRVAPHLVAGPGTAAVVADSAALNDALPSITQISNEWHAALLLLSEAIDVREGHRLGSARRVLEHATRFAAAMQLNAAEQSRFERAALLRSIGKLRLDNDILLKKSVLNYDEWLLLQKHPALGVEILKELNFHLDVADIIHSYHECYDGTGYPDRLEREAIPRLARALKLVDVYCAMTSPRHYRRGHATHEQAAEHFQTERGKHFDPDLVDLFVACGVGNPWPNEE